MQEDSNMFVVGEIQNITTHTMYHVHSTSTANDSHEHFKVTVGIQDTPITMEIDTGSSVTLITKADFLKTLHTFDTLKTSSMILKGWRKQDKVHWRKRDEDTNRRTGRCLHCESSRC